MLNAPLAALDAGLEAVLGVARVLPPLDPVATGLASHRRALALGIAARLRSFVAPLEQAVVAGDVDARERYDALVAYALREMREARPEGLAGGLLAALDRVLYRNGDELLDDPAFPREARLHVLDSLDRFNRNVGAYAQWYELLAADLAARGDGAPLRVHDLATGHGGFALALKERLGGRIDMTASDISEEYLALGRAHARRRGLEASFVVQDATRLESLRGADVDVFLCTQSLHHFPPGMVARMLGEAARVARRSVCFIDAERGLVPLALVAPAMALLGRAWPVVHDTVVSLRRMYFQEELLLLAHLAPSLPASARVSSGRFGAGYAHVRIGLN
jgi:ubiquinone/menaquinone biosynthesis C-methylase UbiE